MKTETQPIRFPSPVEARRLHEEAAALSATEIRRLGRRYGMVWTFSLKKDQLVQAFRTWLDESQIDKDQLRNKLVAQVRELLVAADGQARTFGANNDFASREAIEAFALAKNVNLALLALEGFRYEAALHYMSIAQSATPKQSAAQASWSWAGDSLMRDLQVLARPRVGDGVTVGYTNDRYAGTITQVLSNGNAIEFQADKAINTKTWPEQEYTFERNPEGLVQTALRGKDGVYKVLGRYATVEVGPRDQYQAPEI